MNRSPSEPILIESPTKLPAGGLQLDLDGSLGSLTGSLTHSMGSSSVDSGGPAVYGRRDDGAGKGDAGGQISMSLQSAMVFLREGAPSPPFERGVGADAMAMRAVGSVGGTFGSQRGPGRRFGSVDGGAGGVRESTLAVHSPSRGPSDPVSPPPGPLPGSSPPGAGFHDVGASQDDRGGGASRKTASSFSPSRSGGGLEAWRLAFVLRSTSVPSARKLEFINRSASAEVEPVLAEALVTLDTGLAPHLVEDGLGGTYFMKGRDGQNVAVFKPRDEEPCAPNNPKAHADGGMGLPGMKRGVLIGEAAVNEYCAFLLDRLAEPELHAGVCPTALVRATHSMFHSKEEGTNGMFHEVKDKVGSFQLFMNHHCTAEDIGPSRFEPLQVHRIALLDMRLCNTDRHMGNILVCDNVEEQSSALVFGAADDSSLPLVPIDHGYCLPDNLGEVSFEWLYWQQAKLPFDDAVVRAVAELDLDEQEDMLRSRMLNVREDCLWTLRTATSFVQLGVAGGMTAFEMGTMMTRPHTRSDEPTLPSQLETIAQQAEKMALHKVRNGRTSSRGMTELGEIRMQRAKGAYRDAFDETFRLLACVPGAVPVSLRVGGGGD